MKFPCPIAIWAFCVATAYFPGIPSAAFMPRWWVIAIGLPLVSSLDPRVLPRPIMWCMAAGLAWATVTLFWTPVPQTAALDWLFLALLCGTMIAAAESEDIELGLVAFCWGVAVSCLLCLPQMLGWSPVPQHGVPAGLFLNSEVMSELAAPLLIWTLWKRRWVLAGLMTIPACQSRVGVLVVMAGLLVGGRQHWLLRLTIVVGMISGAIASIFVLGIGKMQSALDRILLWISAVYSITPFGHGLGWWPDTHSQAFDQFVHSDGLQFAVEFGVGSLFFLAIPVMILWRRSDHTAERAAFVGLLVEAAISFPLHLPASGFLVALLAGVLVGARDRVRDAEFTRRTDPVPSIRRQAAYARTNAVRCREVAFDLSLRA